MKSWQKQVLKLGLPILLDWLKSLWSKDPNAEVKRLERIAEAYLDKGDYSKANDVLNVIRRLKND